MIKFVGATGFVGKVLVEKLLRSCGGVKNVYITIRNKPGISSEERFHQFLGNKIFDRIKSENPEVLNKLKYVTGDIASPKLGMSTNDMNSVGRLSSWGRKIFIHV